MHRLIIFYFLFSFIFSFRGAAASASDTDPNPNRISVNCGGTAAAATAVSGRKWGGDATAPKGASTAVNRELIAAIDPVPYSTARISRSQFSYSFHLTTPGQKFIRLHFNPVSYHGFESFNDLFTVEAGPFTLLANFSASITARALSLNVVVKEFCIIVHQNQPLNIVFSPETQTRYNYAFINGIEIISVPSTISYCHGGDRGVEVLGQKSVIYVDKTSALERVYHQTKRWGSSVLDDFDGLFGMWASNHKENANKDSRNLSWRVSVDVGFMYLVRVHLCEPEPEVGLKMNFTLLIDNMIAFTSTDVMLQQGGNQSIHWYNYMVKVEGHKREGKRTISISLNSQYQFLDRHFPLEGFEVFKLSNHDRSLASPNPLPHSGDSPSSHTIQTLLYSSLGRGNAIATVIFIFICLLNIIVHLLNKIWGVDMNMNMAEEENKPSNRAKRLCHAFSLAEIQSATNNFHSGFIIGKGGFGTVYKGFVDNRREIVAIKRSKPDSKQGELQFWTEVEMLSELRHVNLVSLIGYCIEQKEMILVYEYMPDGTLADHLYKLARKTKDLCPLSWMKRLQICIGACRALDYLHTGHGIIHRDVKSSNILLDEKFVAKISDFGLAKTASFRESHSQDCTNLKGTYGYIDPNFFRSRKLTKESDMYSFGVVLLEVLCGRPAVEPRYEEDKRSLTTWAIDNISKGKVYRIVAPSLRGEISPDSVKTFIKIAERCLHDEPKKRPAAAHVVIKLELALQQQEKAESLAPKERTSFDNVFSSVDKSKKKKMNFLVPKEKINFDYAVSPSLRKFTFAELRTATGKFRTDYLLGVGDFGKVYKGWLNEKSPGKTVSRTPIAVKKWEPESMQGIEEWESEVFFLGRLYHPNLVRLLGYCIKTKKRRLLLVYEFMPEGSLDNHLFGRDASVQPLPWVIRLKILIGAGRGLAFLHASDRKVIYRDFKPSHILLDGSYHAKITDFGLAKLCLTDDFSHVSTLVMGTHGYAAPEYVTTGNLYVKSDVYGFGVVLLEMLTGLRALDTCRPAGQHRLVDWMKPHLSDRKKVKCIMDARLEGRYPTNSALEMAQLTLTCLENEPKNRQSMQEIVEKLERIASSSERPREHRV